MTMAAASATFGPYAFTLSAAEAEAAAARYGLRLALAGGLTARHHAPLAAFVLTLLFASILGFTDLISHRAAEIVILLAAAAFMIQRLAAHWRLSGARARGRAALAETERSQIVTLDDDGAIIEGRAARVRIPYGEMEEAEDAGGLVYLWPKSGPPIVLPTRALNEGEAPRLAAEAKRRIVGAARR